MARKKFNCRSFVAMLTGLSFLGLPVTGLANHVFQFDSMSAERHAWMAAHNILGLVFLVFATWHIILNRRALCQYAGKFSQTFPLLSRETVWAGGVLAGLLFVAVGHAWLLR